MKILLLMRHAFAAEREHGIEDHERPLTQSGKDDATRTGQLLAREGVTVDGILCSTALRARQTALAVSEQCGYDDVITYVPELYENGMGAYVSAIQGLDDSIEHVLVVGHNPATEDLVNSLTGLDKSVPAGGLANLHLQIAEWAAFHPALTAGLQNLWRPAEVERELKPVDGEQ